MYFTTQSAGNNTVFNFFLYGIPNFNIARVELSIYWRSFLFFFFFLFLSAGLEEEPDVFLFTQTSFNAFPPLPVVARLPLLDPVLFVFPQILGLGVALITLKRWHRRGLRYKLSMRLLTKWVLKKTVSAKFKGSLLEMVSLHEEKMW